MALPASLPAATTTGMFCPTAKLIADCRSVSHAPAVGMVGQHLVGVDQQERMPVLLAAPTHHRRQLAAARADVEHHLLTPFT